MATEKNVVNVVTPEPMKRISIERYADVSYRRSTNWLGFEDHGFKGQGHRRHFQKCILNNVADKKNQHSTTVYST